MTPRIVRNGPEDPGVSVCIPTYDADSERLERCIRSVEAYSADLSVEIVIADCQRALLGYTLPMNAAMAAAHGDVRIALNDDVEVTAGWLPPLLTALDAPDVWCATPDATHTDGPQVFHPWAMAWDAAAWITIGGLDQTLVMWCSDIDIARRLVDAGHPPVKVQLPIPLRHALNATSAEHPALGPICVEDLARFARKWGVDAETEKHRLAALVAT